jgi:hypothetical protein
MHHMIASRLTTLTERLRLLQATRAMATTTDEALDLALVWTEGDIAWAEMLRERVDELIEASREWSRLESLTNSPAKSQDHAEAYGEAIARLKRAVANT